jgi:tyrosine-protein phosphatase YwqE
MGLLSNIFGKRDSAQYAPVTDYSAFRTDMHSHLIPAIDDGSQSLEESLTLIKKFAELGFRKLITTPHIMSDAYRNTPEIIRSGLDKLRNAAQAENLAVELDAAAEYYADEGFVKLIRQKNLLTINGKYVLFEVSYMNAPDNIYQIVFDIQVAGFVPILAHPERYPFWYPRFEEYHKLRESGVLFQLNSNSLSGYYGPDAKKIGERMINEDMIEFLGSDLHGLRHIEALRRTLKEKSLWKLAAKGTMNTLL